MKQKILNFLKKILEMIEPEGIPFPGSIIYGKIMENFPLYDNNLKNIASHPYIKGLDGSIVDIGTGPANLPIYIAQNNPNCKIIAFDVSKAMIRLASQNIKKAALTNRISQKLGNAAKLPFPDNSIDLIISTGSFHHWKNPIKAFNEIFRVLKENGKAWIYDAVNPLPKENFAALTQKYGRLAVTLFYLHTFSEPFYEEKTIRNVISKSNFKTGNIKRVSILYKIELEKNGKN